MKTGLSKDIQRLWEVLKNDYSLPEKNTTIVFKIKGLGRLSVYNNENKTLTVSFYPNHAKNPNQFDLFPYIKKDKKR